MAGGVTFAEVVAQLHKLIAGAEARGNIGRVPPQAVYRRSDNDEVTLHYLMGLPVGHERVEGQPCRVGRNEGSRFADMFQRADDVEQIGFPGARSPDDGDTLPAADHHVKVPEQLDGLNAAAEHHGEPECVDFYGLPVVMHIEALPPDPAGKPSRIASEVVGESEAKMPPVWNQRTPPGKISFQAKSPGLSCAAATLARL